MKFSKAQCVFTLVSILSFPLSSKSASSCLDFVHLKGAEGKTQLLFTSLKENTPPYLLERNGVALFDGLMPSSPSKIRTQTVKLALESLTAYQNRITILENSGGPNRSLEADRLLEGSLNLLSLSGGFTSERDFLERLSPVIRKLNALYQELPLIDSEVLQNLTLSSKNSPLFELHRVLKNRLVEEGSLSYEDLLELSTLTDEIRDKTDIALGLKALPLPKALPALNSKGVADWLRSDDSEGTKHFEAENPEREMEFHIGGKILTLSQRFQQNLTKSGKYHLRVINEARLLVETILAYVKERPSESEAEADLVTHWIYFISEALNTTTSSYLFSKIRVNEPSLEKLLSDLKTLIIRLGEKELQLEDFDNTQVIQFLSDFSKLFKNSQNDQAAALDRLTKRADQALEVWKTISPIQD